jgi:hypothetical protein
MKEYEDIKHVGSNPQRKNINNTTEMIYAEEWEKKNQRLPWLNSGYGSLELILTERDKLCCPPITQRDAFVAASVIQWLGTNCGKAFIEECEKQIRERAPEFELARKTASRMAQNKYV